METAITLVVDNDYIHLRKELAQIEFSQILACSHFYNNHLRNPFEPRSLSYTAYQEIALALISGEEL